MNDYRKNISYAGRRPTKAPLFRRLRRHPEFWRYFWTILVAAVFAGSVAVIGLFAWIAKDLPDPDNINVRNVAQTTKIFDRTGKVLLYEIHGAQKRTLVELDQISEHVKHATLTAEDRNFYEHGGFDPKGMLRGLFRSVLSGGQNLQSGSTITQQFIKKSVLTDEQTITRKVKELVLSIEIERRYSKDQILKLYLNEIPYGNVSYGIEAAAQSFLGKSAKDLTLSESALLAALPNAPTRYSPYGNNRDALIARQRWIIDGMVSEGYATADEAATAKEDDVLSRVLPRREPIVAPHFVFYVRELLVEEFGEQKVEQGGLKVITTLDADKQKIAEEVVAENLENIKKWDADTAAMAAFDPKTGEVLAMIGSADYFDDEINGQYNAILGKLQPGSSVKPIVYATAFERGFTPSTVVEDIKTNFSVSGEPYEPQNYDGQERGFVTIKEALAGSLNIPAVKTLYLAGIDSFQDFSGRLGYTTFGDRSRYGLALVLGGAEVRPIEHIAAFSAFAQEGVIHETKAILRVEDAAGKELLDATETSAGKKVFDPEIARQINDILSDNVARAYVFGESNYLTLGERPAAAKTGTTNDYKDAWTIGYTPSLVAGVWVGRSEGDVMKKGADGSKIAAPIWNRFMSRALAGSAPEVFTPPQPVVTGKAVLDGDKTAQAVYAIDRVSGKLATEMTPPDSILFFVDRADPRGPVPEHPEADSQFATWEESVARWFSDKPYSTDAPPTEYDDVHVIENLPVVSFLAPQDGGTLDQRAFRPSVSTYARRGVSKIEFFMDGESIGTNVYSPFDATITVPNRFPKGFHTLTARAYDDVGNAGESTITINLTADEGPIGVTWKYPWGGQVIGLYQFPINVSFALDDIIGIDRLDVVTKRRGDGAQTTIGIIDAPVLPSFSISWQDAMTGNYELIVRATYDSGQIREESIEIRVE
jgi:1A family penicillin-binding protein